MKSILKVTVSSLFLSVSFGAHASSNSSEGLSATALNAYQSSYVLDIPELRPAKRLPERLDSHRLLTTKEILSQSNKSSQYAFQAKLSAYDLRIPQLLP